MTAPDPGRAERWRGWHRLLGLTGGLLLAFVAFTGSLLVALQPPQPPDHDQAPGYTQPPRLSLDRLFAAVQAAHPRRYGPWLLELPLAESGELVAWHLKPEETEDRGYAPLLVSVDMASGRIVSTRFWGDGGIGRILELHRGLGLEGASASVAGGLLALILAGSGIVLWRQGGRRAATEIAGWAERSRQAHRLLGLFALPALALSALTGIALNLPERWTAAAGAELHGGGPLRSTSDPGTRPLGIEAAVAVARGLFPHASLRRIALPAGETGVYRVELCQRIETDCRHPATSVWVDRYSGQIRGVDNPAGWPTSRRLTHALGSWHSGVALGAAGRGYWCLAGLVPLLLYASGGWSWAVRRGWVEDRPADWRSWYLRLRAGLRLDQVRPADLAGALRLGSARLWKLFGEFRRRHFR